MKKKGDIKTGGRQRGVPNKVTATLREYITQLVNGQRAQMKRDLKALSPRDRLMFLEKMIAYVIPKQQATTIATSIDDLIKQMQEEGEKEDD